VATALPTRAPAQATNTPVAGVTAVPALPEGGSPTPLPEQDPAPPPGTTTVTFNGCQPEESKVKLEFVLLPPNATEPDAQPSDAAPDAPAVVGVNATNDPSRFTFAPPALPLGGLYSVTTKVEGQDCGPVSDSPAYWMAGHDLAIDHTLPGNTQLRISSNAPLSPCDDALGSGEFTLCWVMQSKRYGDLAGVFQAFKWTTSLSGAEKAVLQASVLPFTTSGDLFAPAGLVGTWSTDKQGVSLKQSCLLCEIDLTQIAPPLTEEDEGGASGLGTIELAAISIAGIVLVGGGLALSGVLPAAAAAGAGVAAGGVMLAGGLLFFSDDGSQKHGGQTSLKTKPGASLVEQIGSGNPIDAFYFRILPLAGDGDLAGGPSNAVTLKWDEELPPTTDIGQTLKCLATPLPSDCPTPTPAPPRPYIAEIVSYHGILPPTNPKQCFISTKDAWPADPWGLSYTTNPANAANGNKIPAGKPFCEPEPDEPECGIDAPGDCLEIIVSYVGEGLEWVGEAWSDLKGFVVTTFMDITQMGSLCEELDIESTCTQVVKTALDAALMALGIPPEVPSFEDLMDQGIEYLAAQAASQISIPPEVIEEAKKLDQYAGWAEIDIEAKLKEEAESAIKANLEDQIEALQHSYAENIGWLPKGVPVTPDPASSTQPPTLTLKVTRNPEVPGTFASCQLQVSSSVTNDFNTPGFSVPAAAQEWLKPGIDFALYTTEYLPVPILDPNESVEIPLVLKPELTTWLYSHPEVQMYWSLHELWFALYAGGTVKLFAGSSATPCVEGDSMTAPAATGTPSWE
jgi:hypothetical protein